MPLPLILGVGAAIAGITGVGSGVHGAVKMKEAKDTMKSAEQRHQENQLKLEKKYEITSQYMEDLGKQELGILSSFNEFSELFEKIKNRPQFKEYEKDDIRIPEYDKEELKEISSGASAALGSAVAGVAGGFAASGAVTLSVGGSLGGLVAGGMAVQNATLAAIGGGAIASGSVALGTAVLSAATLGVGLLVGGVAFSLTGSSLSDKADEAWDQMKCAEKEINGICSYLNELSSTARKYNSVLERVNIVYKRYLLKLKNLVVIQGKTNWDDFSDSEKQETKNLELLVGLLYEMCKTPLVLKSSDEKGMNKVNDMEIKRTINNAEMFLEERQLY